MKALWNKIKNWMNTNYHLLWVSIIALLALGLMGMYFIGPYEATRLNMEPDIFFNKFWPFALSGIIILFAFSKLSKKWVIRISWILGIFAFLLMLMTIFYPYYIAGASRYAFVFGRWINPYAVMLPPYIVLMSHWLSKEKQNKTWTTIGTSALTLFIMGAALMAPYILMLHVYLLLFCILTFKARKDNSAAFKVSVITLISYVALFVLAFYQLPHVHTRIVSMFHPQVFSQAWAARQALASSTIVGNTTKSLLFLSVLPESISVFVFTGMIAKFGILIGLLILALYGCIAKGLTDTIRNGKDQFNKMVSTGVLGLFVIYMILALLAAFGILVAAAYWPFISFGGTIFLAWCVLFGFTLAVNNKAL